MFASFKMIKTIFKIRHRWVVLRYKGQYFFLHSCIILESFLSVREFYVATKTSRIPRNLNFQGETTFFFGGGGGIFCLEYPRRRSKKVNFYFSHFANYRFSFRKLQIFISQTTDFHFVSFRFANYSKPYVGLCCLFCLCLYYFLLSSVSRFGHLCLCTYYIIFFFYLYLPYVFSVAAS